MTVGFAIPAGNDVVIAADTMVSDEYTKGYQTEIVEIAGSIQLSASGKITPRPVFPGWGAIAGAGSGGLVDALIPRLADAFLDDPNITGDGLRKRFERVMIEFHKDHLTSVAEQDRPQILIGLQRPGASPILVSEGTTMRVPLSIVGSIGFGGDFAAELLSRLWVPAGLSETQILAAYVAYLTKRSVQWCGGDTTITTVHGLVQSEGTQMTLTAPPQPITRLPVEYVRDLERIFRDTWANEERNLIWQLISQCPSSPTL